MKRFYKSLILIFLLICSLAARAQQLRVDTIPGTSVSYSMVLVPSGSFIMGSNYGASGAGANEKPQRKVKIDSFWMGIHEVTYDEFILFQQKSTDLEVYHNALNQTHVDAISRPTPQYIDFTFGKGKSGFPAVSMTQQAALRYCHWLYLKTGRFYRLPTEAEWEYACKSGKTDNFSVSKLGQYAWFYKNSNNKYHEPGKKTANALLIHDMLGNVAEWTLDFYTDNYLSTLADTLTHNPWIIPEKKHSRTVKGGSYESNEAECRCSFRQKSDPGWQARDPQIPKSKWWNTDSPFVGFRLVSPAQQPNPEEIDLFFQKAIKD
jgi:formylglycine-generating enzyme required for sulfatase activity